MFGRSPSSALLYDRDESRHAQFFLHFFSLFFDGWFFKIPTVCLNLNEGGRVPIDENVEEKKTMKIYYWTFGVDHIRPLQVLPSTLIKCHTFELVHPLITVVGPQAA